MSSIMGKSTNLLFSLTFFSPITSLSENLWADSWYVWKYDVPMLDKTYGWFLLFEKLFIHLLLSICIGWRQSWGAEQRVAGNQKSADRGRGREEAMGIGGQSSQGDVQKGAGSTRYGDQEEQYHHRRLQTGLCVCVYLGVYLCVLVCCVCVRVGWWRFHLGYSNYEQPWQLYHIS